MIASFRHEGILTLYSVRDRSPDYGLCSDAASVSSLYVEHMQSGW